MKKNNFYETQLNLFYNMDEMHFTGTIIKANIHTNPEPLDSMVELRIIIDITQEIMIEVIGTSNELSNLFNIEVSKFPGAETLLVNRTCNILRDGSGYHFLSLTK